jgi:hypothetical protein
LQAVDTLASAALALMEGQVIRMVERLFASENRPPL